MRSIHCMLALVWLAGCTGPGVVASTGGGSAAASAQVAGTVTYRERIALKPGTQVKVQLMDVSRADAAAVVLGEQVIVTDGKQVPFAFSIAYDPAKIDPRLSYAVSARIEDGGQLLFINDLHYAVITRGAPTHVDMVLKRVGPTLLR